MKITLLKRCLALTLILIQVLTISVLAFPLQSEPNVRDLVLITNNSNNIMPDVLCFNNQYNLLVFLKDEERCSKEDNPQLYYSIYDSNNNYYTIPITVDSSNETLDTQPSLTDLGDKILVSWSSMNKKSSDIKNYTGNNTIDRLASHDIYSRIFDKDTLKFQGNTFPITSESDKNMIYTGDFNPKAVSGYNKDIILAYEKVEYGVSSNEYDYYMSLAYRIYDNATQTWLKTYFDHESIYHEPIDGMGHLTWGGVLGGQRLIDHEKFKTVSWDLGTVSSTSPSAINANAVFAYNYDLYNALDTNENQDIYIQLYNFDTHKMSELIQITNNNICDKNPKIISNNSDTYLFWQQNNNILYYNLNELLSNNSTDTNIEPMKVFENGNNNIEEDFNVHFGADNNMYVFWKEKVECISDDNKYISEEVFTSAWESSVSTSSAIWSKPNKITNYEQIYNNEYVIESYKAVVDSQSRINIYLDIKQNEAKTNHLHHSITEPYESVSIKVTQEDEYPLVDTLQKSTVTINNDGLYKVNNLDLEVLLETDLTTKVVKKVNIGELGVNNTLDVELQYTLDEFELSNYPRLKVICNNGQANTIIEEFPIKYESKAKLSKLETVSTKANTVSGKIKIQNIGNINSLNNVQLVITAVDKNGSNLKNPLLIKDIDPINAKEETNVEFMFEVENPSLFANNTINAKAYITHDAMVQPDADCIIYQEIVFMEEAIIPPCPTEDNVNQEGNINIENNTAKNETVVAQDIKAKNNIAEIEYSNQQFNEILNSIKKNKTDMVIIQPNIAGSYDTININLTSTQINKLQESIGDKLYISIPVKDNESDVFYKLNKDGSEQIVPKSVVKDGYISCRINGDERFVIKNNKKQFNDIDKDSWYSNSVDFVSSRELFGGISENIFAPNDNMTRAMLTTVLHRLEGTPNSSNHSYSDVNYDSWYSNSIGWAANNNIVNNNVDKFNPNDNITREQLAVMLYNYANYLNFDINSQVDELNFYDKSGISSWADDAIRWAINNYIITGKGSNTLDPKGYATRAEVATMIQRLVQIIE